MDYETLCNDTKKFFEKYGVKSKECGIGYRLLIN